MTEEVRKLLAKAEHSIEVAEELMKSGYPSDAASKIYYAMFHAAQALLKSEGIDVTKHSAVEGHQQLSWQPSPSELAGARSAYPVQRPYP